MKKTLWKRYIAGTLASLLMLSTLYTALAFALADGEDAPAPEEPIVIGVVEEPEPEPIPAPEPAPEPEPEPAPETEAVEPSQDAEIPDEPADDAVNPAGSDDPVTPVEEEPELIAEIPPEAEPSEEVFAPVTVSVIVKYLERGTKETLANAEVESFTLEAADATANYDVTALTEKRIDGYTLDGNPDGQVAGMLTTSSEDTIVTCWYVADAPKLAASASAPILAMEAEDAPIEPLAATYTITLDPNGTAEAPATVNPTSKAATVDAMIGEMPTPTRVGYMFDGWYTSANGGTKVTDDTVYTTDGDSTVYAHWTENAPTQYTVKVQKRWRYQEPEGTYGNWNAYEDVASVTRDEGASYDMTASLYTAAGAWETIELVGDPATGTVTRDMIIAQDVTVQMYRFAHSISYLEKGTNKQLTNVLGQTSTGYGTSGPAAGKTETYTGFSDVVTGYTLDTMSGYMPYSGTLSFTASLTNREITRITELYYTANHYTLTFDPNGTQDAPASVSYTSKPVTFDKAVGEMPTPTRVGYTFHGWFKTKDGGAEVTDTTIYKTADDSTVYAFWTQDATKYTVTFDSTGGTSVPSQIITKNGHITMPTAPTKANYDFVGWFTEKVDGTQITGNESITGDVTYYAHWTEKTATQCTVTFDAQGGSSVSNRTVAKNAAVGTLPETTQTHYKFEGWFTEKVDGRQITGNEVIIGDVTFYAHWTPLVYTVTFDPTVGGTVSPTFKRVTYNTAVGELPTPTKPGYDFVGWFTEYSSGTQITSEQIVTGYHTFYAHWTASEYTLTYDANGGTVTPASKSVQYGYEIGELPTPTKENAIFSGWYTEKDGGVEVTQYTAYMTADNSTIYAHWLVGDPYTLYLEGNGGRLNTLSKTVAVNNPIGFLPEPDYMGHTFEGWFTELTGGTEVTADTLYWTAGDSTVYAHWTTNHYVLTLDANGGDPVTPNTKDITFGEAVGALPTPTRANYVFEGWFSTRTGSGYEWTADRIYLDYRDQTVYARWRAQDANTLTVYYTFINGRSQGELIGPLDTISLDGKTSYDLTAAIAETYAPRVRESGMFTQGGIPKYTTTYEGVSTAYDPASGATDGTNKTVVLLAKHNVGKITVEYVCGSKVLDTVSVDHIEGDNFDMSRTGPNAFLYDIKTFPGYTFSHVTKCHQNEDMAYNYYIVSDELVLRIVNYTASKYTLNYDANGGSVTPGSKEVTYNAAIGTLAVPTRTGYTFNGWFTEKDGGKPVTADTVYTETDNSTIYAHWTANASYTVKVLKRWRYQVPEGTYGNWTLYEVYANETLRDGEAYDMTGKLYTAAGAWESVELVATSDPVTGTVTRDMIIAQDVTVQMYRFAHSISYLEKGTNKQLTNVLGQTSTGYGTSGPAAGRTETYAGFSDQVKGYTFERAEGYTPYTGTLSFTPSLTNREETRITTLYYTANEYTLTFDPNGTATAQASVTPTSKQVTYDKAVGSMPIPTRAGYTFDGWYTEKDGGINVTATTIYTTAGDSTVYAHWTKNPAEQYTVTLDANGGSVTPATMEVEKGGKYGDLPTPTNSDKTATFEGWYTEKVGGTKVVSGDRLAKDESHTLYAHWTKNPVEKFTVTLDANGGSVTPATMEVEKGGKYGDLPTPTNSDKTHEFAGWYTEKEDGFGTKVESNGNLAKNESHTLYAHWKTKPTVEKITVTLDANGGVVSPTTMEVEKGGKYGYLPTPTNTDRMIEFTGWYTEKEDGKGTKMVSGGDLAKQESHTLYAHWKQAPVPGTLSVTVRYLNYNGGASLVKDYVLSGLTSGSAYDVSAQSRLNISGYTRRTVDGTTSGVITANVVVTVWYEKNAAPVPTPKPSSSGSSSSSSSGKGYSSPATGESNIKLLLCLIAVLALAEIALCTLLIKRMQDKRQKAHR